MGVLDLLGTTGHGHGHGQDFSSLMGTHIMKGVSEKKMKELFSDYHKGYKAGKYRGPRKFYKLNYKNPGNIFGT